MRPQSTIHLAASANGRHDPQNLFDLTPSSGGVRSPRRGFLLRLCPLSFLYRPEAGFVKSSSTTETSLETLSTA